VNTAEVGSYHDLDRLEEGIHHVPGLRRTDCSNHFVRIVWILGEGDLQLADCQVQEGLVCQRLVACDAVKRKELVERLGKKKEYQTYIAIATETAKSNISTLSTKSRRRSSATRRWCRDWDRGW
jgi:hypothetical protein